MAGMDSFNTNQSLGGQNDKVLSIKSKYLYDKNTGDIIYTSIDDAQKLIRSGKYVDVYPAKNPNGDIEFVSAKYLAKNIDKYVPTEHKQDEILKFLTPDDTPIISADEYNQLLLKPNKTESDDRRLKNFVYRTGGMTDFVPTNIKTNIDEIPTPELKTPFDINTQNTPGTFKIPKELANAKFLQNVAEAQQQEPSSKIDKKYLKDHIIKELVDIKNVTDAVNNITWGAGMPPMAISKIPLYDKLVGLYDKETAKAIEDIKLYDMANKLASNAIEDMLGGQGFGGQVKKYSDEILTANLVSLDKAGALVKITNKLKNKEPLTDPEEKFIKAFALYNMATQNNLLRDKSFWGHIGDVVGNMLPYVEEFALSRGIISGAVESAVSAATKTAANTLGKYAVTKSAVPVAGKLMGEMAAAAPQTLLMPSTYNEMAKEYYQTGDPIISIAKGYVRNYGQVFTESLGGLPIKLMPSLPKGKVFDAVRKFSNALRLPEQVRELTQVQSLPKEIIEEVANGLYDVAIGDINFKQFVNSLPEIAYDTSIGWAALSIIPGAVNYRHKTVIRNKFYDFNDLFDKSTLSDETKDKIKDALFNSNTIGEIQSKLSDVQVNEENAKLVNNYIYYYLLNRNVNGVEDEVKLNAEKIKNRNSNSIDEAKDIYGEEWFILDDSNKTGVYVAKNKVTGEVKMIPEKNILNVKSTPIDKFVNDVKEVAAKQEETATNETLLQPEKLIGTTVTINGKEYTVEGYEDGNFTLFDKESDDIQLMSVDDMSKHIFGEQETEQPVENEVQQPEISNQQNIEEQPISETEQQPQQQVEQQAQEQPQQQEQQVEQQPQEQIKPQPVEKVFTINKRKIKYQDNGDGTFTFPNVNEKDVETIKQNFDDTSYDIEVSEIQSRPAPFAKPVTTGYRLEIRPKVNQEQQAQSNQQVVNRPTQVFDLGDVQVTAEPLDDGSYILSGVPDEHVEDVLGMVDNELFDVQHSPSAENTTDILLIPKNNNVEPLNVEYNAEAVRSDEGQVLPGKPEEGLVEEAGVRPGATEGGQDLQQPASERPVEAEQGTRQEETTAQEGSAVTEQPLPQEQPVSGEESNTPEPVQQPVAQQEEVLAGVTQAEPQVEQQNEPQTEQTLPTQPEIEDPIQQASEPVELTSEEVESRYNAIIDKHAELFNEMANADIGDEKALQELFQRNANRINEFIKDVYNFIKTYINLDNSIEFYNNLFAKFKELMPNSANIIFVQDQSTLEGILGITFEKGTVVDEMYVPSTNTIYIVGIPSKEKIFSLFLHANVAHHGLRVLFNDDVELNKFYESVYNIVGESGFEALCNDIDKLHGYKKGSTYKAYKNTSEATKGAEYMAYLIWKQQNNMELKPYEQSILQNILDLIRQQIDKLIAKLSEYIPSLSKYISQETIDDEYLMNILRMSMVHMFSGMTPIRQTIEQPATDEVLFSKREDILKGLEEKYHTITLDEFLSYGEREGEQKYKYLFGIMRFIKPDGGIILSVPKDMEMSGINILVTGLRIRHEDMAKEFDMEAKEISSLGIFRFSQVQNFVIDMSTIPTESQLKTIRAIYNKMFDVGVELDATPQISATNRIGETYPFPIRFKEEIRDQVNAAEAFTKTGYRSPLSGFLSARKIDEDTKNFYNTIKNLLDKVIANYQNNLIYFDNFIKKHNLKMPTVANFKLALDRWESAAQYRIEKFDKNIFQPFIEHIKYLEKKYGKTESYERIRNYVTDVNKILVELESKKNEEISALNAELNNKRISQALYNRKLERIRDEYDGQIEEINNKFYDVLVNEYGNDVGLYLVAKHALERNKTSLIEHKLLKYEFGTEEYIAEYNKLMDEIEVPDDTNYAGIPQKYAKQIVEKFEKDLPEEEINKLYDYINKASDLMTVSYIESGKSTEPPLINKLRNWKYYVPLTNYAYQLQEDEFGSVTGARQLPSIRIAQMKGRASLPENPILNLYEKVAQMMIFAESEKTKHTLVRLALLNKDKSNVISINRLYAYTDDKGIVHDVIVEDGKVYVYDVNENGTEYKQPIGSYNELKGKLKKKNVVQYNPYLKDGDLSIATFYNGNKYIITINDKKAVDEIKGKPNISVNNNPIFRTLSSASRGLSQLYTTFSLLFALTNPIRDFATYVNYHFVKGGLSNLGRGIQSLIFPIQKLLGEEKAKRYYEEFRLNGGKTDRIGINNLNQIEKIKNSIKKNKSLSYLYGYGIIRDAFKLIRYINETVEISLRFAAYCAARENDKGVLESIDVAKNVTVNFSRRGHASSVLSSIILFANPQIQGFAQHVNFIKNKETRYRYFTTVAAYFAFGLLARYLYEFMKDDDDKGIPKFRRYNYLNIPIDNGVLSMPITQVYKLYYGMGSAFFDLMNGNMKPDEYVSTSLAMSADAFSPITFSDKMGSESATEFISTIVQDNIALFAPLYDVATNTNFFGAPIYKFNPYKNQYDSELALALTNTPKIIEKGLYSLNKLLAGVDSKYTNVRDNLEVNTPIININPSILDYYIRNYGGWAGGAFIDVIDNIAKHLDEEYEKQYLRENYGKPISSNIPIIKNIYKAKNNVLDYEKYKEALDFYSVIDSKVRGEKKEFDFNTLLKVFNNNRQITESFLVIHGNLKALKRGNELSDKILLMFENNVISKEDEPKFDEILKMIAGQNNNVRNNIIIEYEKIKKLWQER